MLFAYYLHWHRIHYGSGCCFPLPEAERGATASTCLELQSSFSERENTMTLRAPCALGIEQEFQLVDQQTGDLCSCNQAIVAKGQQLLGEHLKLEAKQACIELTTGVCPTIEDARHEIMTLQTKLSHLIASEGLSLIRAGTHPGALWQQQKTTVGERYQRLEEDFQDVDRALVIFGLHIHAGIESRELAVDLMNQLRAWLPHFLALSSNSPFWEGRYTGLKSYRSIIWNMLPRTGTPDVLSSWTQFQQTVDELIQFGCIENGKELCWDIRPHPFFPTLELRVCDMPTTTEETLALAALFQALVMKLTWLQTHNRPYPILPRHFIEENKWKAVRYGLDASIVDFLTGRRLTMRDALHELLDFVQDVVEDLGCQPEFDFLRHLLQDPAGSGADRQIAIYERTGDVQQVIQFLLKQSLLSFSAGVASQ